MNIQASKPFYQADARYTDGSHSNNYGNNVGKAMRETLSLLPQEIQEQITTLMRELNPALRLETTKSIAQIDTKDKSVEDITSTIMSLFEPEESANNPTYPSSFSIYA